ncbi:MAG: RNA polymerase sigma factor [Acidimicrobiales bacterium]
MLAEPSPPRLSDLRAGSDSAWNDAVRILGPPLRGFIAARGARDPDATLGDVFLDLTRGIDRLDGDWASFRTLAFVVARRRVVDDLRAAARRPTEAVDWQALDRAIVGGDVEQEAMRQLDRSWMLDLLSDLTEIQRDVLTMRFISGLTIQEVASITGSTETGVKANQRRGLTALRKRLENADAAHGDPSLDHVAVALGASS